MYGCRADQGGKLEMFGGHECQIRWEAIKDNNNYYSVSIRFGMQRLKTPGHFGSFAEVVPSSAAGRALEAPGGDSLWVDVLSKD